MELITPEITKEELFYESPNIICKNQDIFKYCDITLFEHQKQLFSLLNKNMSYTPYP